MVMALTMRVERHSPPPFFGDADAGTTGEDIQDSVAGKKDG
jgi:hypothetical protein